MRSLDCELQSGNAQRARPGHVPWLRQEKHDEYINEWSAEDPPEIRLAL